MENSDDASKKLQSHKSETWDKLGNYEESRTEGETLFTLRETVRYNAIGVCSSGGTIKLYYRSDYLLFLCNMDKFGNMESAVSIFKRSLAFSSKKSDSKFLFTNPISILEQQISIPFRDFDLKLSP